MADTWKSITVEGVNAFLNASIATVIVWVTLEGYLSIVPLTFISLGIPNILSMIIFYLAIIVSCYLIVRKKGVFDEVEKRASIQAVLTILLIWFSTVGHLSFIPELLMMIGIFENLANSLLVGTTIFLLVITIFYGLHGKVFTTLMLEHMPWVIEPNKFLPFFWFWINLLTAGFLNIFEVNMWWYFVDLFFYALFPSLFFGTRVQQIHGRHVKTKDDYFDDEGGFK